MGFDEILFVVGLISLAQHLNVKQTILMDICYPDFLLLVDFPQGLIIPPYDKIRVIQKYTIDLVDFNVKLVMMS